VRLLRHIVERLGQPQTSVQVSYLQVSAQDHVLVRPSYRTEFARGSATEDLVWNVGTTGVVLARYHIDPPHL
jgi:hypothetical protein